MELFQLNWVSTTSGLAAVLFVAFYRLHWPFRFQYIGSLYKKPEKIMRLLEASYRRNRSRTVAMLDKSTHEIMAGNYDLAERFIAEGLTICKKTPSFFNRALVHYLFYNLSTVYFYRGKYVDAIDLAFRVYERDQTSTNALGVIVCSHARLGDLQGAIEAYQVMAKKSRNELKLFCLAEIEAAKGNFSHAVLYLKELSQLRFAFTLHLSRAELDKRLQEWSKDSVRVG